jgi:uncharacterized protein YmfQ (DUF2313 family)
MSNTCEKLFNTYSAEEHTDSLVAYLPGGELFDAKNEVNSVLRRLFAGLAGPVKQAEDLMNELTYDYDIYCTTNLITEWERALGIPDECFTGQGSIEDRRRDVLAKLASLGVSTAKQFIDLAAMYGFKALIPSGGKYGIFEMTFPIAFYLYPQDARFTLYVFLDSANVPEVFPFETTKFPVPFFSSVSNIVECLFRKLAPANVQVKFVYTPLP